MKSLKKFDSSVYIQSHIETNVVKNIITVNPNAENPDKKDITYHKAGEGKYIPIEDPEVRRILATLIPTYDGIGFTMQDLLSVTTFGAAFCDSTIRTFNEFKYFTNIGDITRAFMGSTLEEISMPPINIIFQHNNSYMDTSPFYNCTQLKRVHWGNATLSSNNEKTIENPSNNDVLTSNLYMGCDNLEIWKTSLIFPSTTGETMSRLFTGGMKIKKFIYPDNIRYIVSNIIVNQDNFDTYIEFPSALEKINVNSFADDTNGTFHIVVKSFEPPIVENYDNLGFTNCTVNFYVHDSYYHRYMMNNEWQTINSDSHFNICKLSTLPEKYYTYGTIRSNKTLMECFTKKYNALDILYANSEGDLQVTDQEHQLEVSTGYKPIAICIAGTGFYGDGELARWVALRAAYAGTPSGNVIDQTFTPDTGSNSLYDTERIYSGNPSAIPVTNTDMGIFNKYCRFDINGHIEPLEGYANWGDSQAGRSPKTMLMIAPDNTLNTILLGAINKYRITSMQGMMYTQIVTTQFETYQPNWRTDTTIDNSVQDGHFPIFLAASRFHTPGTNPGDWYIGASGEVIMLAYQYACNNLAAIIQQLDTKYGLNAINQYYTYDKHICSDLYDRGDGVYGFNIINMQPGGFLKDGISDTLTRCQPIMQY